MPNLKFINYLLDSWIYTYISEIKYFNQFLLGNFAIWFAMNIFDHTQLKFLNYVLSFFNLSQGVKNQLICSWLYSWFENRKSWFKGPYIYDVHTEGGEGVGVLKFITYLQILLFLNSRTVVHFCRWRGVGDQK